MRYAHEWHDDSNNWFRSYGNENWEFDADDLMQLRHSSINDLPIQEDDRKFHWPLGRRQTNIRVFRSSGCETGLCNELVVGTSGYNFLSLLTNVTEFRRITSGGNYDREHFKLE